jgi:hypothetical protein
MSSRQPCSATAWRYLRPCFPAPRPKSWRDRLRSHPVRDPVQRGIRASRRQPSDCYCWSPFGQLVRKVDPYRPTERRGVYQREPRARDRPLAQGGAWAQARGPASGPGLLRIKRPLQIGRSWLNSNRVGAWLEYVEPADRGRNGQIVLSFALKRPSESCAPGSATHPRKIRFSEACQRLGGNESGGLLLSPHWSARVRQRRLQAPYQ